MLCYLYSGVGIFLYTIGEGGVHTWGKLWSSSQGITHCLTENQNYYVYILSNLSYHIIQGF